MLKEVDGVLVLTIFSRFGKNEFIGWCHKGLFVYWDIPEGTKKIPKVLLFRKKVAANFADFLEDNV